MSILVLVLVVIALALVRSGEWSFIKLLVHRLKSVHSRCWPHYDPSPAYIRSVERVLVILLYHSKTTARVWSYLFINVTLYTVSYYCIDFYGQIWSIWVTSWSVNVRTRWSDGVPRIFVSVDKSILFFWQTVWKWMKVVSRYSMLQKNVETISAAERKLSQFKTPCITKTNFSFRY